MTFFIFIYTLGSLPARPFTLAYGYWDVWDCFFRDRAEGYKGLTLSPGPCLTWLVVEAWDSEASRTAFMTNNEEYQRMCQTHRHLWLTEVQAGPVEAGGSDGQK